MDHRRRPPPGGQGSPVRTWEALALVTLADQGPGQPRKSPKEHSGPKANKRPPRRAARPTEPSEHPDQGRAESYRAQCSPTPSPRLPPGLEVAGGTSWGACQGRRDRHPDERQPPPGLLIHSDLPDRETTFGAHLGPLLLGPEPPAEAVALGHRPGRLRRDRRPGPARLRPRAPPHPGPRRQPRRHRVPGGDVAAVVKGPRLRPTAAPRPLIPAPLGGPSHGRAPRPAASPIVMIGVSRGPETGVPGGRDFSREQRLRRVGAGSMTRRSASRSSAGDKWSDH